MAIASPRGQKRQQLYQALLAAAERTIDAQGYQALRARDLAQAVGCAVGAIYTVFEDLDAVTLAVKSRTLDALEAAVAERLGARSPSAPEARLIDLAMVYLDFANGRPRLWRSAFEHSSPDTPALAAYMLRLDRIFDYVEAPLAALLPGAGAAERKLLARALFSAVHGIVMLGLYEKLGAISLKDMQWQIRALLTSALAGLRARADYAVPANSSA